MSVLDGKMQPPSIVIPLLASAFRCERVNKKKNVNKMTLDGCYNTL